MDPVGSGFGSLNKVRSKGGERNRMFNNWVKSRMISYFCGMVPSCSITDFGCGKGGDIRKFKKAKIYSLCGVDPSENSLREYLRRYREDGSPYILSLVNLSFNLNIAPFLPHMKSDFATSFFSMSYACIDESSFRFFALNVRMSIKADGYFFGICVNSGAIINISEHPNQPHLIGVESSGMLNANDFGQRYTIVIPGTENFQEYLIPNAAFRILEEEYGFKKCLFHELPEIPRAQWTNEVVMAQLIRDIFPSEDITMPKLSNTELSAAQIYKVFSFRKSGAVLTV